MNSVKSDNYCLTPIYQTVKWFRPMFKNISQPQNGLLKSFKKWLSQQHHVIWTSSSVAGLILMLRVFGLLQASEWAVFDLFFRFRPLEPIDERILIVGIDEQDLQTYGFPIKDADLAELLKTIDAAEPRAIGLDLYRDIPNEPGYAELTQVFQTLPNLVGIEKFETPQSQAVQPPPFLRERQLLGFNNVLTDSDDKVRRGLLYGWYSDGTILHSFALKLATIYLENSGIPVSVRNPAQQLQLGQQVLPRFQSNDGGYINTDDRGFQYLINLRGNTKAFPTVSMNQVLSGKISSEVFRNRIVLVGSTAASVKDLHYTSYSGGLFESSEQMFGVELQAHLISQLLSTALDSRPPIQVWWEPIEWLWIIGWSWVGASLCWKLRSPSRSILLIFVICASLTTGAYLKFLEGLWIPVVPPLMTLVGSAVVVMGYLAHVQEEWKRSTEFLQSLINAIPDPVYVKDQFHQKIVLNQAYCDLVGYPIDVLISRSDQELFPAHETDSFLLKDEMAFHGLHNNEDEGEITDAHGRKRYIATKRSLHQDAAGNLFLVGVIRDITAHKLLLESLKLEAEHDSLTGLPNRKLFYRRLGEALESANRSNNCVALFYLDLNDFKKINDNLGHYIGDLLLKVVAERLKGCLRSSDTVSRLGGDEFTVILPEVPGKAGAARVAEKILDTIIQPTALNQHQISITTSIGISLYPLDTEKIEDLIHKADDAMYRAKKLGKNRYEFFNS
jgi:diguanylate cyclase (GGDEF)-like protein/PAS domain S-box-containing protein